MHNAIIPTYSCIFFSSHNIHFTAKVFSKPHITEFLHQISDNYTTSYVPCHVVGLSYYIFIMPLCAF